MTAVRLVAELVDEACGHVRAVDLRGLCRVGREVGAGRVVVLENGGAYLLRVADVVRPYLAHNIGVSCECSCPRQREARPTMRRPKPTRRWDATCRRCRGLQDAAPQLASRCCRGLCVRRPERSSGGGIYGLADGRPDRRCSCAAVEARCRGRRFRRGVRVLSRCTRDVGGFLHRERRFRQVAWEVTA